MKKKLLATFAAIPLLLCGWLIAFAQDEEEDKPRYVTPVDTFTCSFNEGKDSKDLDKVIADWNAYMDDQGADSYGAFVMTPNYHGPDTFEIGWLGFWTSQEAMGSGIDSYRANSGEMDSKFASVLTCNTHEHWASVQMKAPPEGEAPDNIVLMFSNCTKSDDIEWKPLFEKIDTAVDYMEANDFKSGAWAMWPVFGGEGEPDWDFKWVTSYANYTDFGKAYQHNANGGGRQKMNEIMGDSLDCDTARVYDARTVRRVTAEPPAE